MLALALLLAGTATVTVSSSAATDCPSPDQLTRALGALAPGLVAPAAAAPSTSPVSPPPASLRLSVTSSVEGDVRVDLLDAQGEVVLHRMLPAPPRGRTPDCPALADTVALIVDRYLHDVGYEAPPLPPPPKPVPAAPAPAATAALAPASTEPAAPAPAASADASATWRLGVVASGRRGDVGGTDGDAALALAIESGGTGTRLGARLSGGLAPTAGARWSTQGASQTATLRRLPFRMGAYVAIPAGPGQLEPGLGLGADVLLVSATGPGTADGRHAAWFGDLSLGYAASLLRPLYLRLLSRAALGVPYSFRTLAGTEVWGTPRIHAELGVELGVLFR